MSFKPVKRRVYGSSKEVVSRLLDEGGGVKAAAFQLGLSVSQIYAKADPATPEQLTFDEARRLTAATLARACAKDFASLAGGLFTPFDAPHGALARLIAEGGSEHAAFIGRVIESTQLHDVARLSEAERADLLHDLDEMTRAFVGARRKIAGGGK